MVDVNCRNLSQSDIELLLALDEMGVPQEFCAHSIPLFDSLTDEIKCLTIFYAWKANQLEAIQSHIERQPQMHSEVVKDFLEIHLLRARGQKEKSAQILSQLVRTNGFEIVLFRFANDLLETGNLTQATEALNASLSQFLNWRRAACLFNLGVAAINQSRFELAASIATQLLNPEVSMGDYFSTWLSAQIEAHRGFHSKSYDLFLTALGLINKYPSRVTDQGVLLVNLIQEALWIGNFKNCKAHYLELLQAVNQKHSTISQLRVQIGSAMTNASEGRLDLAYKKLSNEYSGLALTRDHLMGSFFYLWLLVALSKNSEIKDLIKRLEIARDRLGQSQQFFDYGAFRVFASFKEQPQQCTEKLISILPHLLHSQELFHVDFLNALVVLADLANCDLTTFFPTSIDSAWISQIILKRIMDGGFETQPSMLGIYARLSSHESTKALAYLARALSIGDLRSAHQELSKLDKIGQLAWVEKSRALDPFGDRTPSEIVNCNILVDVENKRIFNIVDEESIDNRSHLSQLFLELLCSGPKELSKSQIVKLLGYPDYNPLQHDPIVYALLNRLRQFLLRFQIGTLILTPSGWKLSLTDKIALFSPRLYLKEPRHQQDNAAEGLDNKILNLRQQWILKRISEGFFVSRLDLLKAFNIQKSAAALDLKKLVELGLILRCGEGRGVYYRSKGVSS